MSGREVEAYLCCFVAGMVTCALVLWGTGQTRWLKAELKEAQSAISYDREADTITETVGTVTAAKTAKIQYRTQKVIQYVPQIVTPDIVERYPLPVGFIRVHNAAVLSEVPEPAGQSDGAPSDIGADRALTVIVGNVGTCQAEIEKLTGLQSWVREQQALSESRVK